MLQIDDGSFFSLGVTDLKNSVLDKSRKRVPRR